MFAATAVMAGQVGQTTAPVAEIAIYPGVVWLVARNLREHSTSHRAAS